MSQDLRLSVVVATYNRVPSLQRLLDQLGKQTLTPKSFEVVVVDDGSAEPVPPQLDASRWPFSLTAVRQPNGGAAAARHRGVLEAKGEILVIIDDDMQVPEDFLSQHLSMHEAGRRTVVLGRIRSDPALSEMPVFERWHAHMLDLMAEEFRAGTQRPLGNHLYTGNVSMPREDYLAVGGFDSSLKNYEDAELGLRLEKRGLDFKFSENAYVLHGSDHTSLEKWRRRASHYGVCEWRVAEKHPDVPHANPFRFLFMVHPLSRPLLAGSAVAPGIFKGLADLAMRAVMLADSKGQHKLAIWGSNLVYGMDYFRGLRSEIGPLWATLSHFGNYLAVYTGALSPSGWKHWNEFVDAVKEDHRALGDFDARYRKEAEPVGSVGSELVKKIGFQILVTYRLMRFFRQAGYMTLAKLTSRMLRHLYGSDIHWDAEIAPGVVVVHGMGLCIAASARIGANCLIFQNVTLGSSIDPSTRQTGAPTLETNVHVGPGVTLLGPITVGEGSKVMAGSVVTSSVPKNSLVESAKHEVVARDRTSKNKWKESPSPSTFPKV
jgi:serine acetyltransferase/GT2 family glycosyltransferase